MDSKATLTTDTNVASRGSTDYRGSTGLKHTHASRSIENHRDLLRKSNPESELFFIPDILSLLRARAILRLPNVFWGLSLYKFQGCCTPPWALLSNYTIPSPLKLSHICHRCSVSSLYTHHSIPPSYSLLCCIFIHGSGIGNCSVSVCICVTLQEQGQFLCELLVATHLPALHDHLSEDLCACFLQASTMAVAPPPVLAWLLSFIKWCLHFLSPSRASCRDCRCSIYFHAGGWLLLFGIDLFLWKLQAEAHLPVDKLAAPRLIARTFVLVAC